MPHRPVIDGYDFATAGATLRGTWAIGDFPRLRDKLASSTGAIDYKVEGVRDDLGRAALRVTIEGALRLTCQRCLEPLDFAVSVDTTLVLAHTEAEMEALPDDASEPERIVGGKEMPVGELLEDELLLAVPYAPRHERCEARGSLATGGAGSPFADLKGLLGAAGTRRRRN
ncbi:MAG TPA: YceD family protein [Burkholderiales bacterium]|nr:YceD family protein [Burkholderiales bacterium]